MSFWLWFTTGWKDSRWIRAELWDCNIRDRLDANDFCFARFCELVHLARALNFELKLPYNFSLKLCEEYKTVSEVPYVRILYVIQWIVAGSEFHGFDH